MPHTAASVASFRRLIVSALGVPLGLMAAIGLVLVVQIDALTDAAMSVAQADRVIAQANRLEKLTIDLQSGLRGYLLAGEAQFLAPYDDARAALDAEAATLANLVADDPAARRHVDAIDRLRREWVAYAERVLAARREGAPADTYLGPAQRWGSKLAMDDIRARFAAFIAAEERTRDARAAAARRAARRTLWTVAGITLLGGATLSYLARRQFLEIASVYETALSDVRTLNATLERRVADRTAELEERSSQLADANKELEAFGYSISHDLRAPMRHIAGFADLLARSLGGRLSPDDAENLSTISHTARQAGRMVDDLLAFSRIGRAQLRAADVDVDAVVAQVRRDLAPETAGRTLEWRVGPLPPARGDPALIKMAFQNLLANAVKYTSTRDHAFVEVTGGRSGELASYAVRDNGVGFDMRYADKLFGVFQRLHRAEEFEGTGIGLANVRRIILRHGGRVWAEAKVDEGATFFFTLPAVPEVPDGSTDAPAHDDNPS